MKDLVTMRLAFLPVMICAGLLFSLQPSYAMQVDVPVGEKAITLDGRVSPQEQAGAGQATMVVAGGMDKPKHATTVYTFMNAQGLYVGFVCEDTATTFVVNCTKENGAVFEDDCVQLFITPGREGSKTNYFHFSVNAVGCKYSNRMDDDKPVIGWQALATKTAGGWEAEILIPPSSISARVGLPYWRANMVRERPARGGEEKETTAWINPGASVHNYKRFGFLQFKGAGMPVPRSGSTSSVTGITTGVASTSAVVTSPVASSVQATTSTAVQTTSGVFSQPR